MAKLTRCKVCGTDLSNGAKICPQCGQPRRKPFYRRVWFILLIIIITLHAVRSFNIARNEHLHEQKGYGIFTLANGTEISSKDINALYDESPVAAQNTYVGQTATVTMEVTSISNWAIEDYISNVRFSYSDYTLTRWDYNALSSLRKGDVIRVTGTIENIGGGNWYIELSHITSLKKIQQTTGTNESNA